MSSIVCNQCKNEIKTATYVKCYNCNAKYHFSTCSPLSEFTYSTMTAEKKTNWRCHVCKPRSKSPNNIYQAFVFDENNHSKPIRDDEGPVENERAKKFKDSLSLNTLNTNICSLQSDFNKNMDEMKSQIQMLAITVNSLNSQITNMSATLSTLVTQVSDLSERDKAKEKQINIMDSRINKIEQKMIVKNIELKNVNSQISEIDAIKKIGASVEVIISDTDIEKAYRLKRQTNKIIIEFTSLNKKTELMNKLKRHRVEASLINTNGNNDSSVKYIYINDQLTFNNRQLLWIAKTKAHEAKWKYAWVKNGNIFARKNENTPSIIINNATDIESITSTI